MSKKRKKKSGKGGQSGGMPPPVNSSTAPPIALEDAGPIPRRPEFWRNFMRAIDTEPHPVTAMRGASGISHPVLAVGTDEDQKRLVVVSSDVDARSAAMAQADIQAAVSAYRVLVARPLVVGLHDMAADVSAALDGRTHLSLADLRPLQGMTQEQMAEVMGEDMLRLLRTGRQWWRNANSLPHILGLRAALKQVMDQVALISVRGEDGDVRVDLAKLLDQPPAVEDADVGICAVPLYSFSEAHMDIVNRATDLDEVRDVLRRHNVLQFFFPPPDQLMLGAVDRGLALDDPDPLALATELGHPLGSNELVPAGTDLYELIDALKERNLLTEGELHAELTPAGRIQRATVRFSPREGLLSKIISRISVSIDLKQLFGLSIGNRTGTKDEAA